MLRHGREDFLYNNLRRGSTKNQTSSQQTTNQQTIKYCYSTDKTRADISPTPTPRILGAVKCVESADAHPRSRADDAVDEGEEHVVACGRNS